MSNNLPPYLTISTRISDDLEREINKTKPDRIGVLVDENTKEHCLPMLDIGIDKIIEVNSGEKNKNLETCQHIWSELTEAGFSRKSLLINLGGGVIGDMGGFTAATYKRGLSFINVPTTLLSQVDASIGGKLGIDFGGLKNHIGVFQDPDAVLVFPEFLRTLSERELRSGFAEIIKHALIKSPEQWEYIQSRPFQDMDWLELIPRSIGVKYEVVEKDPREHGLRKILNYGHTIGHAIETYYLNSSTPLLHGEAIAMGMIVENRIACKKGLLEYEIADRIENFIRNMYEPLLSLPEYESLEKYLKQDKKNDASGIRFSLLENEGLCTFDVQVEEEAIRESLR